MSFIRCLPWLLLNERFPDAEVDWLVEKKARIVLDRNAFIHEVIVADTHRWRESWWTPEILRELKGLLHRLRARKYDVAIDFQGLWKSAALGYFSNSRLFLGFDTNALKEPGCRVFYKKRISPSPQSKHVVEKYLDLVRSLGDVIPTYNFDLNISEEDEHYISRAIDFAWDPRDSLFSTPVGGGLPKTGFRRIMPQLHDKLYRTHGLESVVTWGPGEEALVERMVGFLQGKTSGEISHDPLSVYCPGTKSETVCGRGHRATCTLPPPVELQLSASMVPPTPQEMALLARKNG